MEQIVYLIMNSIIAWPVIFQLTFHNQLIDFCPKVSPLNSSQTRSGTKKELSPGKATWKNLSQTNQKSFLLTRLRDRGIIAIRNVQNYLLGGICIPYLLSSSDLQAWHLTNRVSYGLGSSLKRPSRIIACYKLLKYRAYTKGGARNILE